MKLYTRFVIFEGEVVAVFMRTSANRRYDGKTWLRGSYAHTGQHSECYDGMQKRKRATQSEYMELLLELESIGYKVQVV